MDKNLGFSVQQTLFCNNNCMAIYYPLHNILWDVVIDQSETAILASSLIMNL